MDFEVRSVYIQVPGLLQTNWETQPFRTSIVDFPGGAVVKNPPANAGNTGLSPGLGRSHMPRSN